MKLYSIYFSARGTTQKCARQIVGGLGLPLAAEHNWLNRDSRSDIALKAKMCCFFACRFMAALFPSFAHS